MDKENKTNRHSERSEGSLLCHCERSVPQATPTGGPVRDERSEHAISYGLPRAHALAKTETGRSASFCHSCQAQRERESMPRQARYDTFGQMGRSMVEMLGVLAVMGIVGMGGVKMYNVAMNKHHANTLIEQAQRRAVSAASQINLMGHAPSLADFTENTFGGGTFGGVTQEGLSKQFGIQVSGVSKSVCENILSSIGTSSAIRRLSPTNNPQTSLKSCQEENTFLIVYNDDLSSSGGDTIYCDNSACQTVCGQCVSEDGENKCINECPAIPTQCTQNSQCSGTCVGCVIPEGETQGTCQACQRVAYLESTGTQWIDTTYAVPTGASMRYSVSIVEKPKGYHVGCGVDSGGLHFVYDRIFSGIRTGGGKESKSISYTLGDRADIYLYYNDSNVRILETLGQIYTGSASENPNLTAYLFATHSTKGLTNIGKLHIYSAQIYDNNNSLVRDFIPVHAPFKEKGKQNCMFDRVSEKLFCNANNGDDFLVPSN